ncbi:MAG: hypothetical protein IT373_27400 [Polyangiaceae bacterium]|nr:hypothetical protein [Polyangiaceae bacterium]
MSNDERTTGLLCCRHCCRVGPMRIVSAATPGAGPAERADDWLDAEPCITSYQTLLCTGCGEVTLRRAAWHAAMAEQDLVWTIVYPPAREWLAGELRTGHSIAAVGRGPGHVARILGTLERVCADRGASGATLAERLRDLGSQREIPARLAVLGDWLTVLRGDAPVDLDALPVSEVAALEALCRTVLLYVCEGPAAIRVVEERVALVGTGVSHGQALEPNDRAHETAPPAGDPILH